MSFKQFDVSQIVECVTHEYKLFNLKEGKAFLLQCRILINYFAGNRKRNSKSISLEF